jgi:prolyl 4-hydroxylase
MPESPSPIPTGPFDGDTGEQHYRRARVQLAAQDLTGAAHWLEHAADTGHAAALTELAVLHVHGFGRASNPAHGVELLLRAEQAGGTPETPYLLALLALGDVALPRDPQRIDAWIADSARRGFPAALRVAGLHFGQRPEAEFQQAAVVCLQRATEGRDPVGAALFADRLHAGRGVARDETKALDLANQLRPMGVPVELPASDPDLGGAHLGSAASIESANIEPPWEKLRLFEASVPDVQRLCDSPEIAICDGLLSDEECRYLIYSGARFLKSSQVIHPLTGQMLEAQVRTSQDMTFTPTSDDVGIRLLQMRMAALAGFDLAHCEPLTLLRYGVGDQYRPHRDYFLPSAPQLATPGGQRHSTVCTYLNAVPEGGETVFPNKDVSVQPARGRAVMFRNLLPNGTPEANSLHAGLPVLAGEKWLASCWIRVERSRQF